MPAHFDAPVGGATLPLAPARAPVTENTIGPGQIRDDEGGHAAGSRDVEARLRAEFEDITRQLRTMTDCLNSDFVNGKVGTRYRTYAHRSRVVRQTRGRLETARVALAAAHAPS